MELGIVGLGKMGANMARRLRQGGHRVVGFNRSPNIINQLAAEVGLVPAYTLAEVVAQLSAPRVVWLMLPAGQATTDAVEQVKALLAPGDIVIDGGNTNYKDDTKHAALLQPNGIHFVDVGTSGGIWGLTEGYSLMIGGEAETVARLSPIFETLAPAADRGWGHVGPHGAGHYVKMVHNGIEYGIMAAYAEGFNILEHADCGTHPRPADAETTPLEHPEHYQYTLNLAEIAEVWRRGSVISSWLLDLTAQALLADAQLNAFSGHVSDSGEGRWTVKAAIDEAVPIPVISAALYARFSSRGEDDYAEKLLSAMRAAFGGHSEKQPGGQGGQR